MRYVVHVFDGAGRLSARHVDASDPQDALVRLDVAAARVLRVEAAAEDRRPAARPGTKALSLRLFCRELAVLLHAGIPLLEALTALQEKETSAATASALHAVSDRLREGASFSAALGSRPDAFGRLFVAMMETSERTGQIELALREHADYLDWMEHLRARLVAASIYPAILLVSGLAVILFLLVFVVPRFADVLDGLGGELPLASRVLLGIGRASAAAPWATAAVAIALAALPVVAGRSARVRALALRTIERAPWLGPRLRLLALARLYRTTGMLVGAGVPVPAALERTVDAAAADLRPALRRAIADLHEGVRLSQALEAHGLTTPVSLRMLRVGERSGQVAAMFIQAASFYDEELQRLTTLVSRLVNPLLMLAMGLLIGTVVVSLYLPIFQMAEQIQ